MADLISLEFDYGDLPAEKVLECETAFQTACAIENQATRMIGEQFAKAKDNLKHLRNGNGWREWCDKKLNISHTQAQNYINEFENGDFVKNFYKFGKSARWLLVAPTTPQEVRDRADALAEAGEDVSVKTIKKLKAEFDAERQARELFERRAQESQAESNERRNRIRDLETQIDMLKAQPTPQPEKIIVAPADYETAKTTAAKLTAELDAIKKEQSRLINSQVNAKLNQYQSEVDEMEKRKDLLQDKVDRMKEYLASLDGEARRIETHQTIIEELRLKLIGLAAFLSDEDPMQDTDTRKRWMALSQMLKNGAEAIDYFVGDAKPRLAA